ncbi:MAG: hypothetical protein JNL01_02410 [Bdellovibrionales bacterium]|nr:hypothetical protein [Bdellovibrionales bacterium]
MKNLVWTTLTLLILSSCAGLEKLQNEWITENCSEETARTTAAQQASRGQAMNAQPYMQCPIQNRDAILKAYREGFQQSATQATPMRVRGYGYANPRAWFCESHAFMKKFPGFGPTELEAKQASVTECKKSYHEMHCEVDHCQPNQ